METFKKSIAAAAAAQKVKNLSHMWACMESSIGLIVSYLESADDASEQEGNCLWEKKKRMDRLLCEKTTKAANPNPNIRVKM